MLHMSKCLHMRTSVTLPEPLFLLVRMLSEEEHTAFKSFVIEQLEKGIAAREAAKCDKAYKAIDAMIGTGPAGITDAFTTTNDTLYGERGAWHNHGE